MESWQSGNAPDSKSGEPVRNRRAGSNPVLSFKVFLFAFEIEMKLQKASEFFIQKLFV